MRLCWKVHPSVDWYPHNVKSCIGYFLTIFFSGPNCFAASLTKVKFQGFVCWPPTTMLSYTHLSKLYLLMKTKCNKCRINLNFTLNSSSISFSAHACTYSLISHIHSLGIWHIWKHQHRTINHEMWVVVFLFCYCIRISTIYRLSVGVELPFTVKFLINHLRNESTLVVSVGWTKSVLLSSALF